MYDEDDITDEGNDNEDCDDFGTNASSNNSANASSTSALSSQVESLASAAAALRRQFSTASASSQNPASNSQNSNLASSEKLNWRQLVMSEAGRFLYDVAGSGSSSNAGEASAASVLGGDSANTGSGPSTNLRSLVYLGGRNNKRTVNRTWDDDFVLRRQFGALIPAFDPRPGRTNINQTQDVELPENDVELPPLNHHRNSLMYSSSNTSISSSHSSKIRLYLKGPNLADVPNAVVELDEDDATIFAFVQKLLSISEWGQKLDKCRRVWEPTYTVIYENPLPDGERSTIEVTKGTNKEIVPERGSLIRQVRCSLCVPTARNQHENPMRFVSAALQFYVIDLGRAETPQQLCQCSRTRRSAGRFPQHQTDAETDARAYRLFGGVCAVTAGVVQRPCLLLSGPVFV